MLCLPTFLLAQELLDSVKVGGKTMIELKCKNQASDIIPKGKYILTASINVNPLEKQDFKALNTVFPKSNYTWASLCAEKLTLSYAVETSGQHKALP